MQSPSPHRGRVTAMAAAVAVSLSLGGTLPGVAHSADAEAVEYGKQVAFDRKKGNCLACHMIEGGEAPGNIGPPLMAMKARFPDRAVLRSQIWDATKRNPNSMMPPFGLHGALTDVEIEAIIDFLYTK
jgi:sulfur-oxidizing protein SoxX